MDESTEQRKYGKAKQKVSRATRFVATNAAKGAATGIGAAAISLITAHLVR